MSFCSGCTENGCYEDCNLQDCSNPSSICGTYFQGKFDSTTQNLVSGLYTLEGAGQLADDSANGIFNRIVSYGLLTAMTTCQSSFLVNQTLSIECTDDQAGQDVANNTNCTSCKKLLTSWLTARQALDQEANKQNPDYVIPQPDPTLLATIRGPAAPASSWNAVGDHGICRYVCDQCVVDGVDQTSNVHVGVMCDVTSEQFRSAFVQGLSLQSETEIIKHGNSISKVLKQIQNKDDIKTLSFNVSTSILQTATDNLLRELHAEALLYQGVIIQPGSTSVVISNVKQTITVDILASITSRFYTNVTLTSLSDYTTIKNDLREILNLSDFLNEIEADVRTLIGLLKTTLGKILITLVAILFTVVIGIASIFFFKPKLLFGGVSLPGSEDQ